ncbi:MAG TPA: SusD/RagB family nutrient-binding outer membrane lipoprotein [Longimicrobiales bacterium]
MTRINTWLRSAAAVGLLVAPLGACDFIDIAGANPNAINEPDISQLWVGVQVNAFFHNEGEMARTPSVWLQQLAGTDRQFSAIDRYITTESTLEGEFGSVYAGAGLLQIREGMALAEEAGCDACAALFGIHEAYLIGMLSSFVGDLPYSEAVDPAIATPKLDPQEEVYAAIQERLDEAIAGLAVEPTGGAASFYDQMAAADLNFGGDRAAWTGVAYTLKARFYMHWVEAQRNGVAAADIACGGDCLANAIAAAENGIASADMDWRGIHSTNSAEQNMFYQFLVVDRAGYISAGAFGVDLLEGRGDPRLAFYYAEDASGEFVGSAPGENNGNASGLNTTDGAAAADYDQPIATCAETRFILAEAYYLSGNEPAAQDALRDGVACNEAALGISGVPFDATLTGPALLGEIMTQKYLALFLNPELYNDYKRTCLPALETYAGLPIPRRFLYAGQERQTNPNIPSPDQQPAFNTNDPVGC